MARKELTSVERERLCGAVRLRTADASRGEREADHKRAAALEKGVATDEIWMFMAASLRLCRGALDRADDAGMRAAAAEIVGERLLDLGLARLLVLREEGRRLHDHAVDAVAALRGLFVDEGLLHRMRLLRRAEPFERHDLLSRRSATTAA